MRFYKEKVLTFNEKVLDLSDEIKNYREYFKGSSQRFPCYSDWKKHILQNLYPLDTPAACDDFRRYIENKRENENWTHNDSINLFATPVVTALFGVLFGAALSEPVQSILHMGIAGMVVSILLIMMAVYFSACGIRDIIYDIRDSKLKIRFYSDLLEIIREYTDKLEKK